MNCNIKTEVPCALNERYLETLSDVKDGGIVWPDTRAVGRSEVLYNEWLQLV